MKNFYTFNLLLAALLAVAAFATYEPAPKASGSCGICAGFYEFQNACEAAPPLASPANTGTARLGDSTASGPDEAAKAAVLTPAFQYRIGSVRLFGREGSRPFPAELSVTELTAATLPPLDQGMVNVTDYAAGYRMLPDGMVFNGDISIVLPYDSTLLPT